MAIKTVNADILISNEKYLAHQCNCVTGTCSGLAKVLFDAYPYANVYYLRSGHPDTLGTIKICGNGADKRYIINMFAQYYPGKPKPPQDSAKAREIAFVKCLDLILTIPKLESIAFPFNIGCGLGGGYWPNYQDMLNTFSLKTDAKIVIYKL